MQELKSLAARLEPRPLLILKPDRCSRKRLRNIRGLLRADTGCAVDDHMAVVLVSALRWYWQFQVLKRFEIAGVNTIPELWWKIEKPIKRGLLVCGF